MAVRNVFVPAAALVIGLACGPGPSSSVVNPATGAQGTTPGTTTKLIIEMVGGFAYVPSRNNDRLFEVAYLNSVELREDTNRDGVVDTNDGVVCDVRQMGTELMVKRGKVKEQDPPNMLPPDRTLDLDKAVITIPALDNANIPLVFNRTVPPSPNIPIGGGVASDWTDLQYLPSLRDHHNSTGIRPGWRDDKSMNGQKIVNGRLVLRGGTIVGSVPTDPGIQTGKFTFTRGQTSLGDFATIDRLIYSADVPGSDVELVFADSAFGYKRLKLEPPAPGQPVKLLLNGVHDPKAVSSFASGQELKDFCTFYALLEPRPLSKDWLRISYSGPVGQYSSQGQPSPGFYCIGDGF